MVFKSEHLQTPKDSFVGLRQNRALSKKWTHFSKSQWETEGFFKTPFQSIIWRDGVGSLFPSVITDHLIGFNFEPSFPAALGKRWRKPQGQVVLCYAWQVMSARLGRRGGVERKQEKWLAIMLTHCQNSSALVAMILVPRRGRDAWWEDISLHRQQKPCLTEAILSPTGAVWEHMWVIPWMKIWHGAAGWPGEWQTRASGVGNCYWSPCSGQHRETV